MDFIVNAVEKEYALHFNQQTYGPLRRKAPVRIL